MSEKSAQITPFTVKPNSDGIQGWVALAFGVVVVEMAAVCFDRDEARVMLRWQRPVPTRPVNYLCRRKRKGRLRPLVVYDFITYNPFTSSSSADGPARHQKQAGLATRRSSAVCAGCSILLWLMVPFSLALRVREVFLPVPRRKTGIG